MSVYMCTMYIPDAWGSQIPGTRVIGNCEPSCGYSESNLSTL